MTDFGDHDRPIGRHSRAARRAADDPPEVDVSALAPGEDWPEPEVDVREQPRTWGDSDEGWQAPERLWREFASERPSDSMWPGYEEPEGSAAPSAEWAESEPEAVVRGLGSEWRDPEPAWPRVEGQWRDAEEEQLEPERAMTASSGAATGVNARDVDQAGIHTDPRGAGRVPPDGTLPPGASTSKRGPHRGARRLVMILVLLLVLAIIGSAGAGVWAAGHLKGTPGQELTVKLTSGNSASSVADQLVAAGVVSEVRLFRLYLSIEGAGAFEDGSYTFHQHEGYTAALRDLRHGPIVSRTRLVIPEGFTLAQIAQRVGQLPGRSAAAFTAAAGGGQVRSQFEPTGSNTLEGLLFPDTYLLSPDQDEPTILSKLVAQFDTEAAGLGLGTAPLPNGLTAYQTIIMASIIEREAKLPEDRPMIARVILNRLHQGKKLQIDATVLYALGVQKPHVSNADLKVASPYNTYVIAGLPPGPIASPGRASLLAAMNPAPGPWLWYVLADSNGKHAFASTEKEFEKDQAAAQAKGLLG